MIYIIIVGSSRVVHRERNTVGGSEPFTFHLIVWRWEHPICYSAFVTVYSFGESLHSVCTAVCVSKIRLILLLGLFWCIVWATDDGARLLLLVWASAAAEGSRSRLLHNRSHSTQRKSRGRCHSGGDPSILCIDLSLFVTLI